MNVMDCGRILVSDTFIQCIMMLVINSGNRLQKVNPSWLQKEQIATINPLFSTVVYFEGCSL